MNQDMFIATALENPATRAVLERLPALECSDAWLVAGAIFQPVWNVLTHRAVDYGIKDYDISYFDNDTSWEAEDRIIKRAAKLFGDLGVPVEVRNQARVHIWYEQKFNAPYPPLTRANEGIDRYLTVCSMVGVRCAGRDYEIYAPNGFDDVENLVVRPNRAPNFRPDRYREKAERWRGRWPEITIVAA